VAIDLQKLKEPFPESDIEWRVDRGGKTSNGKLWAFVLAYVTNRAVQERLDTVVSGFNWSNKLIETPSGGKLCGIGIRSDDQSDFVWKWDGSDNTNYAAFKGGLSGAMKRAAVQWGIGRYLYNIEQSWANIHDNGKHRDKIKLKDKKEVWIKWDPPALPEWALPKKINGKDTSDLISKQMANQLVAEIQELVKSETVTEAEAKERIKGFWNVDKISELKVGDYGAFETWVVAGKMNKDFLPF